MKHILLLGCVGLALASPAYSETDNTVINSKGEPVYLFEWMKQPEFKKLWLKQVWQYTPKAPMNRWVRDMSGPMPPLERVKIGGKEYYATEMCQPHNCLDNKIGILTNKKQIFAYHVIEHEANASAKRFVETYTYGKPNVEQLHYLKTRLE
ncbi:inhibitor of vertebrate lysozyme family protein [Neisseria sp. Dent CA1/247]|uniref:Ivy family c-type lysozyme inhibitor n=1 Tax=Neisseria sp. Dent CA1/247 TaxID=2912675 RepID=UPI001FCF8ACD|nr:Ivy family c-type lysozyme inhibitor [Neisseria sp. Dent CA1/247]UOO76551.1 inhibitor of vertebrate lysozyme family protein [Neisseria sp. Dent CA1/247]